MSDGARAPGRAARTTPAIAVLSLALVGACSDGPGSDEVSPYSAEFENAFANATSDFERGVLEDGEITSAEYEEAMDNYLACMHDLGVDVTLQASGEMYQYETSTVEEFDLHDADCRRGTVAWIEPLYDGTINNPGNVEVDRAAFAAECLVEAGLAPEGYSAEELGADLSSGSGPARTNMDDVGACFEQAFDQASDPAHDPAPDE